MASLVTVESTVVTGFEKVAKDECFEKLGCVADVVMGRIVFDIESSKVPQAVSCLKGVDNIYVVMHRIKTFNFPKEKADVFTRLEQLPSKFDWTQGLDVWKRCIPVEDNTQIRFRATCHRTGLNHSFTSHEAAIIFGSAVQDLFGWKPDMKNYDLEVVLHINEDDLYVSLALTNESLHMRNLEKFGPTSLRATIAYNMLRLGAISSGDIVCDPLCGGGSLPIEAAINWPSAHHVCGDFHELASPRTLHNITFTSDKLKRAGRPGITIDVFRWDARKLPLKDNSVDVFVTDLVGNNADNREVVFSKWDVFTILQPFGKRLGSKFNNRVLYPSILQDMARASQVDTGRAVILTHDRRSFITAISKLSKVWRQVRNFGVNIGGLAACVYVLQRTGEPAAY